MATTQEVHLLHRSSAPLVIEKSELEKCGTIALVSGIASSALGLVVAAGGITLCIVATPITLAIGVALLLFALALYCFSFNCFMAMRNIKKHFDEGNQDARNLSEAQFKAVVEKNTIFFGCITNMVVEKMKSEKVAQATR